jgi:hypothetical protein
MADTKIPMSPLPPTGLGAPNGGKKCNSGAMKRKMGGLDYSRGDEKKMNVPKGRGK